MTEIARLPQPEAPDFHQERALIVPSSEPELSIARGAVLSMGLRERPQVAQIHADGGPIDPESGNKRIGWYRPTLEVAPTDRVRNPNDRYLSVDFEKSEVSRRITAIKNQIIEANRYDIPITLIEIMQGLGRIYPVESPQLSLETTLPAEEAERRFQTPADFGPKPIMYEQVVSRSPGMSAGGRLVAENGGSFPVTPHADKF